MDRARVRQLFKAVVRATDEINETLFLHRQMKRRLQIFPMAQASEFHVPNQFTDKILMTKNGFPDVRSWADQEITNPDWKPRESLLAADIGHLSRLCW